MRNGKKYAVVFGLVLAAILIIGLTQLSMVSPRTKVEEALGVKLPSSAMDVQAVCEALPDSKVFELWAAIEMPLDGAKQLANDLGVPFHTEAFVLRSPKSVPLWWKNVTDKSIATAPNKWLLQTPTFRPAFLAIVWIDERVFIYKLGFPGSGR